jgi:AbrB family looped-hinge helix DNA binding protein
LQPVKGKIIAGGRVALPAEFRRALDLSGGDTIYFTLDGDQLTIRSARSALKRIQDRLRPYDIALSASGQADADCGEDAADA